LDKMDKADDEGKSVEEIVAEGEKKGEVVVQEKDMTFVEKRAAREKQEIKDKLASWVPKTDIGKDVKAGKEKDIDNIFAVNLFFITTNFLTS